LNDSTRDACQRLILCDSLEMGLRQTSLYGTQITGLRMDITPNIGSSGETD